VSAFDPSAPGLPLVGGGGATLPDTPANVLLDVANEGTLVALAATTGVGSAVSYIDAFQAGAVAAIGGEAAGTALIADGLGDVATTSADVSAFLATANAAAARAAIGAAAAAAPTTHYASDGTAANGAGGDATASVSGTGAGSTVAFGISGNSRLLNSSGIACGSWVSPAIAQTASRITAYIHSTALSGFATGGYRYLQASLRRSAESPPASLLMGSAISDQPAATAGNMRANSNMAPYTGLATPTNPLLGGTDRWLKVVWDSPADVMQARVYLNLSTGSTRPTAGWYPVNLTSQTQATTAALAGSVGTGDVQVIVGLESYGTGGATTATLEIVVEVES